MVIVWNLEEKALSYGTTKIKFEKMDDLVLFAKTLEGKVKIEGESDTICLDSGEVVWLQSYMGVNDEYLDRVWRGIDHREEENISYSIYDVYSERELL